MTIKVLSDAELRGHISTLLPKLKTADSLMENMFNKKEEITKYSADMIVEWFSCIDNLTKEISHPFIIHKFTKRWKRLKDRAKDLEFSEIELEGTTRDIFQWDIDYKDIRKYILWLSNKKICKLLWDSDLVWDFFDQYIKNYQFFKDLRSKKITLTDGQRIFLSDYEKTDNLPLSLQYMAIHNFRNQIHLLEREDIT